MLDHLKSRGGSLDIADTKKLIAERDAEWDISENPQKYFNRVEQAIKALTRAGITSDLNERRDMALYFFKSSGEFDAAVREWENKPTADKTWNNIKTFISAEYAKENKQNKLTAKQFKANMIEEQAAATEELIANINVWATTSGNNCTRAPTGQTCQSWLLPKQDHPRPLDTRHQKNMFHIGGGRLRN